MIIKLYVCDVYEHNYVNGRSTFVCIKQITFFVPASAVCMFDSRDNSFTLSFAITFNGDPVDRVQYLSGDTYVSDTAGNDNEVACTLAQGSVDSASYVLYESKVFLDGVTPSQNGCGGRRVIIIIIII